MNNNFILNPSYGKQSVPVFKVIKNESKHTIIDMEVEVILEGDISESWITGTNHQILPTETQKNTCYAIALTTDFDCIEDYGIALGNDIIERHSHITKATISISSRQWNTIQIDNEEHNHAFIRNTEPNRKECICIIEKTNSSITSGIKDLILLKTTQSGFTGYIQDKYTNLQPVGKNEVHSNRLFCTKLESYWDWLCKPSNGYNEANHQILDILIKEFSGPANEGKFSKSLQETAYQMAKTVLTTFENLKSINIITPNVHFYAYPLEQFGLNNPNIVFQSTDPKTNASGKIITNLIRE